MDVQVQLPGLQAQEATLLLAGVSAGWLLQVTHTVCPTCCTLSSMHVLHGGDPWISPDAYPRREASSWCCVRPAGARGGLQDTALQAAACRPPCCCTSRGAQAAASGMRPSASRLQLCRCARPAILLEMVALELLPGPQRSESGAGPAAHLPSGLCVLFEHQCLSCRCQRATLACLPLKLNCMEEGSGTDQDPCCLAGGHSGLGPGYQRAAGSTAAPKRQRTGAAHHQHRCQRADRGCGALCRCRLSGMLASQELYLTNAQRHVPLSCRH